MIFNYAVNDDKIIFTSTIVYTGNVNTYECRFSFSPKWDSYDKFAVFSGEKSYTVPITEECCKIPKEVLTDEGIVYIGIFGSSTDNGTDILSTSLAPIKVAKGAYNQDISESSVPSPEIWQEYLNSLKSLASHSVPKIGEDKYWYLWNQENKVYESTGVRAYAESDTNILPLTSASPEADKIYLMKISESTDFILPEITDGRFHQILILATIENTPAITYGTDCYFNGVVPTADNGECDIIFEYDGVKWTAGIISKGCGN